MRMCLKWVLLIIFSGCLLACGRGAPQKKQSTKTYVVHSEAIHKKLYFTGTVQPLKEYTLTSPIDAVVDVVHFQYGQHVKKDDIVFTLNSVELQKQYNDTLTEYLKAKDSYTIARSKFIGTEDLWQAGLLSKNNYLSEKSSLNTTRISLMQATRKLSEMLEKMGDVTYRDLSHLSFSEFDKVRSALTGKHNIVQLKSPSNGLLLYPPKGGDDKSSRMTVGAAIKAGQVLALIGNLSGIRVEIDVPEVDMDKIKTGMAATVHGVAFAKEELKGTLVSVNAQASGGGGSSLPSFTGMVEVKTLDAGEESLVKVGMSASIELAVDSSDKLMVPISSVKQKHGLSFVMLVGKKGVIHEQPVVTGVVHANKVVIDSGLKAGDVISYD